jgi:hypothetical protein
MLSRTAGFGQKETSGQLRPSWQQPMTLKLFLPFSKEMHVPTKTDFFSDLSDSLTYWTKVTTSSVTDQTTDLMWVNNEAAFKRLQNALADKGLEEDIAIMLKESMRGLAHSFLCILDGATKLSEKGRVYLVDPRNNKLGEGLHQEFAEFLYDQDQTS